MALAESSSPLDRLPLWLLFMAAGRSVNKQERRLAVLSRGFVLREQTNAASWKQAIKDFYLHLRVLSQKDTSDACQFGRMRRSPSFTSVAPTLGKETLLMPQRALVANEDPSQDPEPGVAPTHREFSCFFGFFAVQRSVRNPRKQTAWIINSPLHIQYIYPFNFRSERRQIYLAPVGSDKSGEAVETAAGCCRLGSTAGQAGL